MTPDPAPPSGTGAGSGAGHGGPEAPAPTPPRTDAAAPRQPTGHVPWVTLEDRFSPRANSLNFLRLVLAFTVVAAHTWLLGLGGARQLVFNLTSPGDLAVDGFFAISGFLIAASALRNNLGRYLWQRCLRILPAFWVCLVVTAFLIAPIAWWHVYHPACGLRCYFSAANGPFGYLWNNWFLHIGQTRIAGTPAKAPWPTEWNGSIWTLAYEFACYLVVGALAILTLLRRRLFMLVAFVALWLLQAAIVFDSGFYRAIVHLSHGVQGTGWNLLISLKFTVLFLAGCLLYLYRDRLPDSRLLALGCGVGFGLSLLLPTHGLASIGDGDLFRVLLAYPLVWLGIHLPFRRVGAKNDYSYGVYIYAYPVQQLLAMLGVTTWGLLAYGAMSVACTIPLAVGSWWLVERHALRLKKVRAPRLLRKRHPPAVAPGAPGAAATAAAPAGAAPAAAPPGAGTVVVSAARTASGAAGGSPGA